MHNWKVGDRARIDCPGSPRDGKCCTLLKFCNGGMIRFHGYPDSYTPAHWDVCIDGIGNIGEYGYEFAYEPHELKPPHDQWAKDLIARITQPDPSILQQTTEEERAREKQDKERVKSFLRSLG